MSKDEQFFTAYYPDVQDATKTRVWGRTTKRTMEDALEMVLAWLWLKHFETCGERRPEDKLAPEPPSVDEVVASNLQARKSYQRRGLGRGRGRVRG
jgi:hypothetical protein